MDTFTAAMTAASIGGAIAWYLTRGYYRHQLRPSYAYKPRRRPLITTPRHQAAHCHQAAHSDQAQRIMQREEALGRAVAELAYGLGADVHVVLHDQDSEQDQERRRRFNAAYRQARNEVADENADKVADEQAPAQETVKDADATEGAVKRVPLGYVYWTIAVGGWIKWCYDWRGHSDNVSYNTGNYYHSYDDAAREFQKKYPSGKPKGMEVWPNPEYVWRGQ